jgi:poly-gamma-glutamate synthesis protein (capsule biosynthesis protein)
MDAGPAAVKETVDALRSVSVDTVGGGEHATEPWIWSTQDATVGVLNWVTAETNPDPPDPSGLGPNYWPGDEAARAQISSVRQRVDDLVVFIHWSDELFFYPRPADRELARKLIEFGADAVVGHHSHVVRGYEQYRGKPIFYGLGNYYFDDFPSPSGTGWLVKQARRNREVLVVELKFRRGQPLTWLLHSFWQDGLATVPDPQGRAVKRVVKVSAALDRSDYPGWYEKNRRQFDRWQYRWYFRFPAMGVQGTLNWMFKTVRNSAFPND